MYITNKYFNLFFPIIFLLLLFLSCETVVDVELPKHKPMVVVNSIGNPDEPWELNISLSKGILDEGKIEIVNNAKVEILENGNPVSTFNHYSNGFYKSTGSKPETNVNYELRVSADGFETVTSSCKIHEPIRIESVIIDTVEGEYEQELELTISFTDIPNSKNYYSLSVLSIEKWNDGITYTYPIGFSSNDLLIRDEGRNFDEGRKFYGEEALFDDTILNGKNYKLKIFVNYYHSREDINLEFSLSSLSEDYYKYLKTKQAQDQSVDNPFAEPVIIYSNIKNGLGIFSGYSSSKYNLF